jgi:hypothetical protein
MSKFSSKTLEYGFRNKTRYCEFIKEYVDCGHAESVCGKPAKAFYIPHHCVTRKASTSTKLRVVFDANARMSPSTSLNELLLNRRIPQDLLTHILKRFRTFKVGFVCDITKMFWGIDMNCEDCDLQCILWEHLSKTEKRISLRLLTLTYGTTSAPYLATKSLELVGNAADHDEVKTSNNKSFYMDDYVLGADDTSSAAWLTNNVYEHLKAACFRLRKWASKDARALAVIPQSEHAVSDEIMLAPQGVGTLGMGWKLKSDPLRKATWIGEDMELSKRSLLGEVMRTYDPLGLIAPVPIRF